MKNIKYKILLLSSSNQQNISVRNFLFKYLKNEYKNVYFAGDGLINNDCLVWKYSKRRGIFDLPLQFITLFILLLKERPTHIISFAPKTNFFCGMIIYFINFKHCPVITGLGAYQKFITSKNIIINFLVRIIYSRSEAIIFMNSDNYNYFNKIFPIGMHFGMIPGEGYDGKYSLKMATSRTRDYDITFISRLIPEKGIIELLNACKILKHKYINIRVMICGGMGLSKNDEKKFNNLLKNIGAQYLGYISDEDKDDILLKSKVVVLPSIYGEGLPFILLEAQDAGCLVASTKQSGCLEGIYPDFHKYCFDLSAPDIVDKLDFALNNFDHYVEKDIVGVKNYLDSTYSVEKMLIKYQQIFQESSFFED